MNNQHRKTFAEVAGVTQPAPAPRFSRTVPEIRGSARRPGEDSEAVLLDYGMSPDDIRTLRQNGVIPLA